MGRCVLEDSYVIRLHSEKNDQLGKICKTMSYKEVWEEVMGEMGMYSTVLWEKIRLP